MITGPQRLIQCPHEYQDRLIEVGGVNRYGQPNYKFMWGEAYSTRAGGYFAQDGFTGYQNIHLYDQPGWLLLEWHAPEEYGTPTTYYIENYDEASGLQTMGEYPYEGRYEVLFPLIHREFEQVSKEEFIETPQGWERVHRTVPVLTIEPMPLNNWLINTLVPLLQVAKGVSADRKLEAIKAHKAEQEAKRLETFTDARMDASLAFGGNHFVGKHGFSTDLIEKKMRVLERGMSAALAQMKHWGKGISTRT